MQPGLRPKAVTSRRPIGLLAIAMSLTLLVAAAPRPATAQTPDATILDAREAFKRKDRNRLGIARANAAAEHNTLAMWVDYWELTNRIADVQQDEVNSFATRWSGTYVEDRFRNDWLLELGRRQDWTNFAAEYPRFRMNDDREVACYALLVDQQKGRDVRDAAAAAWLAQRDADDGCALMASTLYDAKQLTAATVWRKARWALDAGRTRAARQAMLIVNPTAGSVLNDVLDSPARYLSRSASAASRNGAELATLALMRIAANDADAAAAQLADRWERTLPADLAAWAWGTVAKQAATRLQAEAADYFLRATKVAAKGGGNVEWPDDTLAWKVRAGLRADHGRARWQQVVQAIDAMSAAEQREPAWLYWKARGLQAMAKDSQDGESLRGLARDLMAGLVGQMNFYGALAAEEAGRGLTAPPRPAALSAAEIEAARGNAGLGRALHLIEIGLRPEGVREWNYSLRGMGDRELFAAAQLACDREVWDRCINTSEKSRDEIDMTQRFPTPYRRDVSARAREIGLDPAYVYGLIRQESRFIMDARSGVGASGLMQIMPATARWTAQRIGLAYTPALIADRDTNLRLGTAYLKLVLDDFGGSQALAAAAYNAGPGRPRKWREGPTLEPAVWAETIPFAETRDYVKKVLSNAAYYALLMGTPNAALKPRLGRAIGPAAAGEATDTQLP